MIRISTSAGEKASPDSGERERGDEKKGIKVRPGTFVVVSRKRNL